MIRSIGISLLALSLTGCLINLKPGGGHDIVVKPTKAQIEAAAVKIVCGSFGPIYFSGSIDSAETIAQIRRFNAAWKAYGCKFASK